MSPFPVLLSLRGVWCQSQLPTKTSPKATLLYTRQLQRVSLVKIGIFAKEFKKQVKQILKEIRKRGIYVTDEALETMLSSPEFGIRLLTEIKSEREKISILEQKIEEDKAKVIFADAIEATKDTIYIGDLAKLLQKNGRSL